MHKPPPTIMIPLFALLPACAHIDAAGQFGQLIYDECGHLNGELQRKCIERVVAHAAECAVENPPADADTDGDTDGDADPGE